MLAMDVVQGKYWPWMLLFRRVLVRAVFKGELTGDVDVQRKMLAGDVVFKGGC